MSKWWRTPVGESKCLNSGIDSENLCSGARSSSLFAFCTAGNERQSRSRGCAFRHNPVSGLAGECSASGGALAPHCPTEMTGYDGSTASGHPPRHHTGEHGDQGSGVPWW